MFPKQTKRTRFDISGVDLRFIDYLLPQKLSLVFRTTSNLSENH